MEFLILGLKGTFFIASLFVFGDVNLRSGVKML